MTEEKHVKQEGKDALHLPTCLKVVVFDLAAYCVCCHDGETNII